MVCSSIWIKPHFLLIGVGWLKLIFFFFLVTSIIWSHFPAPLLLNSLVPFALLQGELEWFVSILGGIIFYIKCLMSNNVECIMLMMLVDIWRDGNLVKITHIVACDVKRWLYVAIILRLQIYFFWYNLQARVICTSWYLPFFCAFIETYVKLTIWKINFIFLLG